MAGHIHLSLQLGVFPDHLVVYRDILTGAFQKQLEESSSKRCTMHEVDVWGWTQRSRRKKRRNVFVDANDSEKDKLTASPGTSPLANRRRVIKRRDKR